jgi:hypothetical protein
MMASQISDSVAQEIMRSYLPIGWKVAHPKSQLVRNLGGQCFFRTRTIHCAPVVDDYTLFTFLHEVGHATLHLANWRSQYCGHVKEYEAEQFAITTFRKRGLRVTRSMLEHGKFNVLAHIANDRKQGIKIDPRIWKWCDPNAPQRDKARYERRKHAPRL